YTAVGNEYSYHWEMRPLRNQFYRHDNAPHKKWKYISTFPKHCHDGSQDNVVESHISDFQDQGLRQFLNIVRERLRRI
ncbi:MAG: toxin-antitoxin system TumE family protein, partial [Thermodesulfobacteriota bacterium]